MKVIINPYTIQQNIGKRLYEKWVYYINFSPRLFPVPLNNIMHNRIKDYLVRNRIKGRLVKHGYIV